MSGPNLDAMIATLRAEKEQVVAQYDAAITALMNIRVNIRAGQMTLDSAPPEVTTAPTSAPTLVRPYAGMTVAGAAEDYLRAVNRSVKASVIARALEAGGLTTTSKKATFTAIVYNALHLHKDKTFRRDKRGRDVLWGLAEWPEAKVA